MLSSLLPSRSYHMVWKDLPEPLLTDVCKDIEHPRLRPFTNRTQSFARSQLHATISSSDFILHCCTSSHGHLSVHVASSSLSLCELSDPPAVFSIRDLSPICKLPSIPPYCDRQTSTEEPSIGQDHYLLRSCLAEENC